MATKIWVKKDPNATWSEVKKVWVKTQPDTIWQRVRKIWAKTSSTVWKLVFSGGDLPVSDQNDPISIRYNSYSGPKVTTDYAYIGGPDANGNDTTSLTSNWYLYGDDGGYTNYTSITDRRFKYAYPTTGDVLGTLEDDDILNTKSNMQVAEECYIWYTLRVWNGTDLFDSVEFEAGPLYMIKQDVESNTYTGITGTQAVNNTIYKSFNFKNYWYNSPDEYRSYIAWYRSVDGVTLPGVTSQDPIGSPQKIDYFYSIATTNSSTQISGSSSYNVTASDTGYYIVARVFAVNSNTDYFDNPYDLQFATDGAIGTAPPTNTSNPYFQLISGSANTVGSTYRLYPGSWDNPASGTTLQYRYYLDKNNQSGTNILTYPSTTTFTTDTYYDYTFDVAITNSIALWVVATNGSTSDPAYALTSIGPIEAAFTEGTISVNGGSPYSYPDTSTKKVTNGATLSISTSGWPAGTVFTYQWYKSRNINGLPPTLPGTASSITVSTVGEGYYCAVSWSNPNYPTNGSGTYFTDTYTVVPAAPSFTLTNNSNGTFTISSVSTSGGSYYEGSYIYGGNSNSITRTITSTNSTFNTGAASVSVTLYGVAFIGGDIQAYYSGYESTTSSVSVTNQSVYQATGAMRRATMPLLFTDSSQTIWVSTNGFVATTVDPGTTYSYPSSGLVVGPFVADLKQTSLSYKADSSNFYVRWQGHALGDATQSVDYLMKFYWNSYTVDIYFITNNLTSVVPSTTAIQYGGSAYQAWSGTTGISGMSIPSGMTSETSQNNVDDARTPLSATKPSPPSIITQPTVSPSSGTAGTTQFTSGTGSWSGSPTSYTYQWRYNDQGSTWIAISGATSSTYTPPSNYVSLYGSGLRCYVTAYNENGASTPAYNSNTTTVSAPLSKLSTPTGVNASDNRTDGVNITWNAVSGAAYYGVWYGGAPGYDSLADFGGNRNTSLITGTSYLDTSISSGSSRDYYVQAYRSGDPTGTKSEWGGPNNGTRLAPVVNYTVTWNANGGSVSPSSTTVSSGSQIQAPTPSRSGYTFNGWYNSSSGGSYIVGAGGNYTVTANVTLYAQWTIVATCTCSYSDYGSYYYSPQCCSTGSSNTGLPTVYNSGNSVCSACYPSTSTSSCCPNITKLYTKCSANDVTNSSSPVYFYCYSTGQCINSSQGAGGTC